MKKIFAILGILLLLSPGCSRWNSASCTYTETRFDTPEEMLEYFAGEGSGADSPNLFVLGDSFAGLEFEHIKLSGVFLYYTYIPSHTEESANSITVEPKAEMIVSSAPSNYNNEVQSQADEDDSSSYFHDISIGWNINGHGSEELKKYIEGTSKNVNELSGCPGFYYSDRVTRRGTLVGKTLYWVQEDCFFRASIPIDLYEEALAELTAQDPFIQRTGIR